MTFNRTKGHAPSSADQAEFDQGVDDLFTALEREQNAGNISLEDMGRFFPDDVKRRAMELQEEEV